MAFCSFTKDGVKNFSTLVDNYFITEFLPEATGDAVKVYLYGLYLCKNISGEFSLKEFASDLYMTEDQVKEIFQFWEDFDVVSVMSDEPYTVKYLPLTNLGKPRKFKSGKYDDFNKAMQLLISERMISPNEYADYISFMEEYSIKPEVMLMITKYCVDLKGGKISGKYIVATAKSFAMRGVVTTSQLETELNDYNNKSSDVQKILSSMGLTRKPDIDDFKLYSKWTQELLFTKESIMFVAKKFKIKSTAGLDNLLNELYSAKKFSENEITEYLTQKEALTTLTKNVLRQLSVYVEVISPVIENYINPWIALGFNEDMLLFVANFCFKKNRRTLEKMDETIKSLYKKGLLTLSAIADYAKKISIEDNFIKQIFSIVGMMRSPNDWDRTNLNNWRNWGFSDEMIEKCAELSSGKTNPTAYMNTILSTWKANGIFTIDKIPSTYQQQPSYQKSGSQHTKNERNYTEEELNKLILDFDDINF